jgi:arylsulfatase
VNDFGLCGNARGRRPARLAGGGRPVKLQPSDKRRPETASSGLLVAQGNAKPALKDGKKLNIVINMSDDVGWGDLDCYGGADRGAPTPSLDKLAAEGMRFTNSYGQASCTAGRASFLTGRIPIRTALSFALVPGDPNGLRS